MVSTRYPNFSRQYFRGYTQTLRGIQTVQLVQVKCATLRRRRSRCTMKNSRYEKEGRQQLCGNPREDELKAYAINHLDSMVK